MNKVSKNTICSCMDVRMEDSFSGWNDFDDFSSSLRMDPRFVPIEVKVPYSNVGLQESWYKCRACDVVWRLVEPDPPFGGLWSKVTT